MKSYILNNSQIACWVYGNKPRFITYKHAICDIIKYNISSANIKIVIANYISLSQLLTLDNIVGTNVLAY